VTVLLLIDTREESPQPARHERQRRSLRPLAPIPAAMFLLGVADMVPPLPSYLLTLACVALVARTLAKLVPMSNGLEDHRQ
jgi:hypothetical protein